MEENISLDFPIEYLQFLKLLRIQLEKLTWKNRAIVILKRNLSVTEGLCERRRLKNINYLSFKYFFD